MTSTLVNNSPVTAKVMALVLTPHPGLHTKHETYTLMSVVAENAPIPTPIPVVHVALNVQQNINTTQPTIAVVPTVRTNPKRMAGSTCKRVSQKKTTVTATKKKHAKTKIAVPTVASSSPPLWHAGKPNARSKRFWIHVFQRT